MNQYSQEQFDKDVEFFNTACGKTIPQTQEEFDREVMQQQRLVQEESTETMIALIENDPIEILDGLVDVLYTTSWLVHLLKECQEKGFVVSQLLNTWLSCIPINEIGQLFDEQTVLEAMQRVAVNNNTKFTAVKEQAERWKLAMPEYELSEVIVDGVVYYCLRDEAGKIRKHCDYVSVDLSDLVGVV